MGFTLDIETMKLMTLFERITKARIKDCLQGERTVFVVQPGEIRKAVGKQGATAKLIEKKLKRKIKIVEFNPDVKQFIRNLVHPSKVEDVEQEGETFTITTQDTLSRGMIIGRGAQTLRWYESIVKRYFPIKELKVK